MLNQLTNLGTYTTGILGQGAAEIAAYDPQTRRLFVVNGAQKSIDILNLTDPSEPTKIASIDLSPYGGGVNSVAVKNGIVAMAVEASVKQDPGQVVFFDTAGTFLKSVAVGALPDMLTFTPDGRQVLVANEGEPNDAYTVDPEGSVSIINLAAGVAQASVTTASFTGFNAQITNLKAAGVRFFGPNATVAQDVEPEYITVSADAQTAWITLQENNAIAVLDLRTNQISQILPLGYKNFNLAGNGIDASDRDGTINIQNWQVLGMYQPDAIASYSINGETYLVTANEGDARAYSGFNEEARIASLNLDPTHFANAAELKTNAQLGRLKITRTLGDTDGDGDYDQLYAFGARSFSVWKYSSTGLVQVFDSGDAIEKKIAEMNPAFFNVSNDNNTFDDRSDDKGPEPEGLAIGEVNGRMYAFIGLERDGGILVYDLTDPHAPTFVQYINNRDFNQPVQLPGGAANPAAGDLGPEGILLISAAESPTQRPILVSSNEISGSSTTYDFGANRFIGTLGNDTLQGSLFGDLMQGRDGDDVLNGGDGNDVIFSGRGRDVLRGQNDGDRIYGGAGDDWIDGGSQADRLYGRADNDQILGSTGDDRLYGDSGNDMLSGGDHQDHLVGGTGHDTLRGGYGCDVLTGVNPQQSLAGQAEVDRLLGGFDSDRFVLGDSRQVYYNDGNGITQGTGDYALISDFQWDCDVIQLKGVASDYRLGASPSGLPFGTAIFLRNSTGAHELIAIVENTSYLNLSSWAFQYV